MARRDSSVSRALSRYFRTRIEDPSEVDALVEEVFARIVAHPDGTIDHLGGHIAQIVAGVLAEHDRRRGGRHGEADWRSECARYDAFDTDRMDGKEDERVAIAALLSLPMPARSVFILHRLEGRKYREVAAQLGISTSAVETHMARAVQHLSAFTKAKG